MNNIISNNALHIYLYFETPDPASWIRIKGEQSTYIGKNGVAHGDFNGDGLEDLIFGSESGRAFIAFGRSGNWSSFSTTDIQSGAVPGFYVLIETPTGVWAGNAGDMNGDGIEDMLISDSITATVVFGALGETRSNFDVFFINGTNGFSLSDQSDTLGYGSSFGLVGDVNGDGLADLGVGSSYAFNRAGRAYIVFARNVSADGQQWPASLNLTADLDGTNGFIVVRAANSQLGSQVTGAGDVNGDGVADVFIGSGKNDGAWIIWGHSAPWNPQFSASFLDGSNGFYFASTGSEYWGCSGGRAGDVNGDGFDDVVIGGYKALDSNGTQTGAAVIIFGHSGQWPAELDRNDAAGSVGFLIDGPSSFSSFGWSAHGVGDANGDGLSDFTVCAPNWQISFGYTALVFGVADDHCAVCSNTTDACLVCDDGFILNGPNCVQYPSSSSAFSSPSSSAHQQGVSVVVIINFLDNVTDPTELEEEIASVLGINSGLVSVVVISPTEVEVTIIGGEETAQRLVDIINNGGTGSDGSGLGLLRKAIEAHIRKDTDGEGSSGDDGVDAAPRVALLQSALLATVTFSVMAL